MGFAQSSPGRFYGHFASTALSTIYDIFQFNFLAVVDLPRGENTQWARTKKENVEKDEKPKTKGVKKTKKTDEKTLRCWDSNPR